MTSVALVHDYLTQRGGAERVVLSMVKAFPDAPLYTSMYEPTTTFPEFASADVRPFSSRPLSLLRRHHRLALPILAPYFSRCRVAADAVLCSSSGWAHGIDSEGRKIVYCYAPARWLYQPSRYLRGRRSLARYPLKLLHPYLLAWDRRAAASADQYLTSSTAVADHIRDAYGIEARLLPPPHTVDATGPRREVAGIEPGFVLCVSRLLPYKNVDAVIGAFGLLRELRLIVVGTGPEGGRLRAAATPNVSFVGSVSDEELRWLYWASIGLVAAAHEDYGLTPLEAAAFGKPSAVLRWGGFLDTVVEGQTGGFFQTTGPPAIAAALQQMVATGYNSETLRSHADRYSEDRFIAELRDIVLG